MTILACFAAIGVQAQKYALIDMEYILKNIPAYERANEQLNQQSRRWQGEIDILVEQAQTLYKKYQSESMFLSDEQRAQREKEILDTEKKASDLISAFSSLSALKNATHEELTSVKGISDRDADEIIAYFGKEKG